MASKGMQPHATVELKLEDVLPLRTISERYPISTDTLKRWIKAERLPHRRVLGKLYVRPGDVEKLLFRETP